ncbi:hypothetical protein P6166_04870 [Stenotrophomonas sp. HITSZ_GD]|jgi:hypothetical protein|uniref:hypothetical protein n=1 Tax=Stenotrophomonas sp. HITSZ_GD TaxID=3037248 RepID=UPI001A912C2C|nr:hypothetical protein [Stenotrophomonas sp. HITSZ_GD]MDG2524690.1 hypothetical protein [Stenotrophomonas sp. HITSZ_GD]
MPWWIKSSLYVAMLICTASPLQTRVPRGWFIVVLAILTTIILILIEGLDRWWKHRTHQQKGDH